MKKPKYNNFKVTIDGHKFDSRKEGNRYLELRMLEKCGKIQDLTLQPKFKILDKVRWNGKTLCTRYYIADFMYKANGKTFVEDVKSPITRKNPVYTLKKQMFLLGYSEYEFVEV